ncbi:ABC transporter ATP-binding protein [Spirosoma montaniterrae]|uniref:Multidrug ABC transporter ATP-binding protein n=1 Tax=Spirosoma montaniterrae TaxID=1178516 RepID=A0A1P9WZ26_9BACT|nr:ABC transporter ATP-binding protein [Spirosoma montaniterrae]AQG80630.1 multidrug ABC transporter ATP-binding protein [Spirosoma montaniterrae]
MELQLTNLTKTYSNGVKALNNVSLTMGAGLFGLLGPNGAGKSSLMRTVATLQEADSGSIAFSGPFGTIDVFAQPDALRQRLGYLPQEFGVYPRIAAETLLDHLAVLKGITNSRERKETVTALLHKTNLYNVRTKSLGGYSGGMKQRFGIAQALLANPSLIIVDEPTAGLDPGERNRFLNLLGELGEDRIIILSTHIVEDVQELCRDMAIVNRGTILFQGHPDEALATVSGRVWRKRVSKAELTDLKENANIISERMVAGDPVVHILADTNPGAGFQPIEPTLEDVYFTNILGIQQPAL